MDKTTQDLAWAYLPKEVRKEVRMLWELDTLPVHPDYDPNSVAEGAAYILTDLFGHHNLTSDTEPEEMLMISLKKVKALYEDVLSDIENSKRDCDNGSPSAMFGRAIGMKQMLLRLFGDKCLPDKESEQFNLCDICSNELKDSPDCSYFDSCGIKSCSDYKSKEQPRPKFRIGQLVRFLEDWVQNKPLKVINYDAENNTYQLEGLDGFWLGESQIEPYIEPRFKVGDKVRIIKQNHSLYGKTAIVDVPMKDAPEILVNRMGNLYSFYESDLEPYTEPETKEYPFKVGDKVIANIGRPVSAEIIEIVDKDFAIISYRDTTKKVSFNNITYYEELSGETKDNMEKNRCEKCKANAQQCANSPCQDYPLEEKELNLCELLKGCEREKIFIVDDGECIITEVTNDEITFEHAVDNRTIVFTKENISLQPTGFAYAYPSKESFLSRPLDAYSAWMEWKEARKPKRWRAEEGKEYWYLSAFVIPEITSDDLLNGDDKLYECGNYFRTKIEAHQAAEAVRECLEKFHEQNR